jgi:hypothetical protein
MAIVISAVMMLGGASYISRLEQEREATRKKKEKSGEDAKPADDGGGDEASPRRNSPAAGSEGAGEALASMTMKEGTSPGYISLG